MKKNISEEVKQELRLKELQDRGKDTSRKYKALQEENRRLEKLLQASDALSEVSVTSRITRKYSKNTGEATAVALASDWHIEGVLSGGRQAH